MRDRSERKTCVPDLRAVSKSYMVLKVKLYC